MISEITFGAFIALTVAVLAYWMYWRITHRRMLELAANVPGPPALPILGNALLFMVQPGIKLHLFCWNDQTMWNCSVGGLRLEEFRRWWLNKRSRRLCVVASFGRGLYSAVQRHSDGNGNSNDKWENIKGQLEIISELFHKHGQYIKFWLGPDLNIAVKNPTDIRLLLTSNKVNQKGPAYDFMIPFIGPGILSGGPTWRNHRKIATPSYNKRSVQIYSAVFNKESEELAKVLSSKDPSKTFNVFHDVLNCTTQCVCQTLMGLSKEDSKNVKRMVEVVRETQNMYELIFSKMTKWWLQIPFIYWITGKKKKEKYYMKAVDEMVTDIVQKRMADMKKNEVVDEDSRGIVDRYILSKELDEQEIKWETFSLFTTSQEAGAKIASAVLLFLAHLPEWQNTVYNEIVETLGPQDDYVTEEQVKKLQYLDMVYKEVLRYLSIAALIQRTVEEEITVYNGNITLPVGTSLVIAIHNLHRDPQYWEEPDRVMPERFLPENMKRRDPNAFVPFSLGAMDCLGRVYGTTMIKTLVVRVLRHIQLEADGALEDLDIHVAISVKFAKGYNLRTRPRKNGRLHSRA